MTGFDESMDSQAALYGVRLQPEKITALGDGDLVIFEKWFRMELGSTVGRDSTEPTRNINSVHIMNT